MNSIFRTNIYDVEGIEIKIGDIVKIDHPQETKTFEVVFENCAFRKKWENQGDGVPLAILDGSVPYKYRIVPRKKKNALGYIGKKAKEVILEFLYNNIEIDTATLLISDYMISVEEREDYAGLDVFISCYFGGDSADGVLNVSLLNKLYKLTTSHIDLEYAKMRVSYVGLLLTREEIENILIK